MKLYAERPVTRSRQIIVDVAVVVWAWAWAEAAAWLYRLVMRLAVPGQRLEDAGRGLSDNLTGAGNKVGELPGGGAIGAPLRRAAAAAAGVADAGADQQAAVGDLATVLGVLTVVVPVGLVLLVWLPLRLRWIRRASAAARLRADVPGRDLLALRALTRQPLRRLTAIDPEIATAWRRGDPDAVRRLADLELGALGLSTAGG
jgi:hypothetical protein